MPTFCRHNRLEANCPICSRKRAAEGGASTTSPARRPVEARHAPTGKRRTVRAAGDGYENDFVPGLRATVEAARLADELAFATARLEQLRSDPPGLYADVALAGDPEEAAWLAFLIAYVSPLETPEPFAVIDAARTTWASGELPDLDQARTGPRSAHDPTRGTKTLEAYRAWARRAGSQAAGFGGEPSWTPQRRFERAFERLALPGFGRGPRYELLVLLGTLGVFDLSPWSLHLTEAMDPTTVAAKRVFGIGDAMNLQRRASDLATAADVPIEALDLALLNWSAPEGERITAGARDVDDGARAAGLRRLLHAEPAEE